MNKPIFSREDFTLCDVPVPVGYPQSQTHSGIAMYKGNYYLTTSPYPNKKYSTVVSYIRSILKKITGGVLCNPINGEVYGNPCIYIGDNKDEIPIKFKPLTVKPLMETPEAVFGFPAYNSDPDIFIENDIVYILNRVYYRTSNKQGGITDVFLIKGSVKYEKFKLESLQLIKEWERLFVSPCLINYRGKYVFTYLHSKSALDAKTFDGLYLQEVESIDKLSNNDNERKILIHDCELLPWHMSLFSHKEVLYTIITCVNKGDITKKTWQMLGEFNQDLTELTIYPTPLTDYNSYRSSALVREDGLFVLYNTVVWEHIKGTNSVDGRDVVMAKCVFEDFLNKLRDKYTLILKKDNARTE